MSKLSPISRRQFLRWGGATLVVLAGGAVWRAVDQGVFAIGDGPAYEAWQNWQSEADGGTLALVRAAILAANPHNTQPWLFRIGENEVDLFADTSRNIGAIDPFLREMHIGLGCALENMMLAAPANGYEPTLTLLPDANDPTHIAHIAVASTSNPPISNLYQAIPNRHTNRAVYADKLVSADILAAMDNLGADDAEVKTVWFTDDAERKKIADLTYEAAVAITADEEQSHDSGQWFRHDWDELQRRAEGVTLDAQSAPPAINAIAKMLPPLSQEQNDKFFLQSTRAALDATPVFGILVVPESKENEYRLRGGRLWQRLHLWATTQGLAMQPVNYASERADREESLVLSQVEGLGLDPHFGDALRELIGDPNWQALMPFRLGHPTVEASASPRRSVEQASL